MNGHRPSETRLPQPAEARRGRRRPRPPESPRRLEGPPGSEGPRRPRRRARRLLALLAVVLLLGYGGASAAYLVSFRVEREPGTVVIEGGGRLGETAVRLARAFAAESPGRVVVVVDGGGLPFFSTAAEVPVEVLVPDVILATGLARPGPFQPAAEVAPFYQADLLAAPFPSARVALSLDEARQAAASLAAGEPAPWSRAGLTLIDLAGRAAEHQLLAVDGVYPTLATVLDGSYPLRREVRVWLRTPAGPFGLPGRLKPIRSWVQPNYAVLLELESWLRGEGARSAFYGAPCEVRLLAVGDVMLGRNVGRDIAAYGVEWPFGLVASRLAAADVTFANLEAPFGTSGAPLPGKQIWLRARNDTVRCLELAGIDVVSLANNHILDYDSPGLLETLSILDSHGIAHAGAGPDLEAARAPAILEVGGPGGRLKIAFLAYTEFADAGLFWDFSYRRTFLAEEGVPGCAPMDLAIVAEDIAQARERADLVVVAYHWGAEDINYPAPWFPYNDLEAIARRTIDLGACLVLGTHPHAIQGLEVYHGGLIAYSLGNFVMDQKRDVQKESMILEVQLGPSGVLSARVTPVWIDTTRPRVLEGDEAERLYNKIETISAGFREDQ